MCTPTPALFSHSKATTQVCYSVSDTQRTQPARRKAHGGPGEELHHQEHCTLPSSTRSCPPRGGGHAPHGGLQQPSCHPLGPCWLSPKDQVSAVPLHPHGLLQHVPDPPRATPVFLAQGAKSLLPPTAPTDDTPPELPSRIACGLQHCSFMAGAPAGFSTHTQRGHFQEPLPASRRGNGSQEDKTSPGSHAGEQPRCCFSAFPLRRCLTAPSPPHLCCAWQADS